jgi:hypothetical protein
VAKIPWKTQAELDVEAAERQRQAAIQAHEQVIRERQQAYVALLTTGATEAELANCKAEIQALLDSLEVLRSAS